MAADRPAGRLSIAIGQKTYRPISYCNNQEPRQPAHGQWPVPCNCFSGPSHGGPHQRGTLGMAASAQCQGQWLEHRAAQNEPPQPHTLHPQAAPLPWMTTFFNAGELYYTVWRIGVGLGLDATPSSRAQASMSSA